MVEAMSPSKEITAGQIGKVQELLAARLRKSGLSSEYVQQVLASQGDALADELVTAIRKRVEMISDLIVRRVRVNRSRNGQEALDATGRMQYTDRQVVDNMPKGDGEEVEVVFFNLGRYVSDAELDKEYELRGLIPADLCSLAAVNEADPAFADEKPNGTHWQDLAGKWCFATFHRWLDGRYVFVDRHGIDWSDEWWFAGLRK